MIYEGSIYESYTNNRQEESLLWTHSLDLEVDAGVKQENIPKGMCLLNLIGWRSTLQKPGKVCKKNWRNSPDMVVYTILTLLARLCWASRAMMTAKSLSADESGFW